MCGKKQRNKFLLDSCFFAEMHFFFVVEVLHAFYKVHVPLQFILRDLNLFGVDLFQLSNQKQTLNFLGCQRYSGMYDKLQRNA